MQQREAKPAGALQPQLDLALTVFVCKPMEARGAPFIRASQDVALQALQPA
ncbi:MAG TPA: hypothetical protein VN918_00555 [Myxococcaceae bacterium]|nr:hypothetical protein [Myxococcaceae bacterium]